MAGTMQLDKETADKQAKMLVECGEILANSRTLMAKLGDAQNGTIWTTDGAAPELIRALRAKYQGGEKWLAELEAQVVKAGENFRQAIEDTDLLDEATKASYTKLSYQVTGARPYLMI